ncbi:dihydrofolate reductase family protein [Dyella sp. Tek66A03]|jgi:dihydrofolate reductase|uniref:dihydrofolate reductase family protein n=1 Tax=Dyella sp. Tek66A03 TaxID=3458298 RepID=UPI0031B94230
MAKIIHSINATLNGSCSHHDAIADAEHHGYAADLLSSADALLFGRTTFDLFAGFWPQAASSTELPSHTVSLGRALGRVKKYVLTKRQLISDWDNTFQLSGQLDLEIESLRRSIGGTIVIFGSPGLASSLAAIDQIDEYHILFQPFVVNSQPKLFESVGSRLSLRMMSVTPFASGVLLTKFLRQ